MIVQHIYSILLGALSFVLVLGVAVFIHEAGHFIVARLSGIRVEKFSIGFGKAIFTFKRGDTEYVIAPIPMGGFVKMAGDNPAEVTGKPDEFYSISPWRRMPTVIAGPAANVIGAFVIFFALAYLLGKPYNLNVVGKVYPGSLEAQAGLARHDQLLALDNTPIRTWEDYTAALTDARDSGKETITLKIRRGESEQSVELAISEEAANKILTIADVDLLGPAQAAGLEEGDHILSVAGEHLQNWTQFQKIVKGLWEELPSGPRAKTVSLRWQSPAGEVISASITPVLVRNASGELQTKLGVASASVGMTPLLPPKVHGISRGYPATGVDIKIGAEILSVNGKLMDHADDVERAITFSYSTKEKDASGKPAPIPVELCWRNPGETEIHTASITPLVEMTPLPSEIGMQTAKEFALAHLGITFAKPRRPVGLVESLMEGVRGTVDAAQQTWFVLKGLFTGQVNSKLLGGPVAIVQISVRVGKDGLERLLWFCAFLQVNLAILNLLPIPVLDGGHLVVALAEGASRRTFSLRTREVLQYIGLAILAPLFLFVFYNDFDRLGLFNWIKELVS